MSNEIIELPGTGKIKNALPPKQVSNIKWIHTVGSGIYQQAPSNVNSESLTATSFGLASIIF